MEELKLNTGAIIETAEGGRWRIIHVSSMTCRLFRMDVTRREFADLPASSVMDLVSGGKARIVQDEPLHVDEASLSEARRVEYQRKRAFLHDFAFMFGPDYTVFMKRTLKPEYVELYKRHGISQAVADRLVNTWFSSGFQTEALITPKVRTHAPYAYKVKTGRRPAVPQGILLDERAHEAFAYGLKQFRSGRNVSISEAYVRMVNIYYLEKKQDGSIGLVPIDRRPTERQFRSYVKKNMSRDEVEKLKTSRREYQNNSRLLLGGNANQALRPGVILEADALEVDLNIVSKYDRQQNISRPIAYVLVDTYSHAIVAFHVGYDNNSMMGLSSLMMNLFDDKETLLKSRGLSIDHTNWWPSPFVPQEIRCDRGSDFASDSFSRICEELRIKRTLEPGGMGSMKGLIEESFRLFHHGIRADFERMGFMNKRHDSNHRREACLTLDDVFLLFVDFVRFHNTYNVKSRRLTRDMMEEGVEKNPISIWNYGVGTLGGPVPVTYMNRSKLLYSLMIEERASISRSGINFHGLVYDTSSNDPVIRLKMKEAVHNANRSDRNGNRLNSMVVRFDPRSIDNLYYIDEGELRTLAIVPSKCGGLKNITWDEYDDYRKAERESDREGAEKNLMNKVIRKNFNDFIASHVQSGTYAQSTGIGEARRKERRNENYGNRIFTRLEEKAHDDASRPVEKSLPMPEASSQPVELDLDDLRKLMLGERK